MLNTDVLGEVFIYLDVNSLMRCRMVCHQWKDVYEIDKFKFSIDLYPYRKYVTDDILEFFKGVKSINIYGCKRITDQCLNYFKNQRTVIYNSHDKTTDQKLEILFKNAESCEIIDIAKLLHEIYKPFYVCSSPNYRSWYVYRGHHWAADDDRTLKIHIANLADEFRTRGSYYHKKAISENKDDLLSQANKNINVVQKLSCVSFKAYIMKEAASLFYSRSFDENLDDNCDLIGFNNGVYDLEKDCFRNGTPDDNITLSVGYDYKEFNSDHKCIGELEEYFSEVMYDKEMREYILTMLSSYLDGYQNEKLMIWMNKNFGSKLNNLDNRNEMLNFIKTTLGNYCYHLPSSYLDIDLHRNLSITTEMANTQGIRFLFFQDMEFTKNSFLTLKELSCSDYVYTRPLFREPIRIKRQFQLFYNCDSPHNIWPKDKSFWDKAVIVPWENKEKSKFNELEKNFQEWRQAFMWMLINVYYKKYKDRKFKKPAKITNFVNKYCKWCEGNK